MASASMIQLKMVACACALPRLQVNVPLPKLHFRGSTLKVTVKCYVMKTTNIASTVMPKVSF
jgi:hypothetical protein